MLLFVEFRKLTVLEPKTYHLIIAPSITIRVHGLEQMLNITGIDTIYYIEQVLTPIVA